MSYGSDFVLTLFTNDPSLAGRADRAGLNRIGVDLDRLGKQERQSPSYRISNHDPGDLANVRAALRRARLFARTDALHDGSAAQVDQLIRQGAEVLMLPMFSTPDEAARFIDLVRGRAEISLLVETAGAAARIREIVRLGGVAEVFVGLNDLHLSLNHSSRFEVLVSGVMDRIADAVLGAGLRFGFGGLGRVGDRSLPVPPSLIYAQYPRLGATAALAARSFLGGPGRPADLDAEAARARRELDRWAALPRNELEKAKEALRSLLQIPQTYARRAA